MQTACRYAVPGPIGCALVDAQRGGMTLAAVGRVFDLSREGARKIEVSAFARKAVQAWARSVGLRAFGEPSESVPG